MIAILLAAIFGAVASSTIVLNGLVAIMGPIPLADRATTALKDIAGFGPIYAAVFALPFALAFGLAGFVARRTPAPRAPLMAIAGAGASAAVLSGVVAIVGTQAIAGARDPVGFAVQVATGALAGLAFALLHRPKRMAV
jgi:hypothetical protein